MIGFDDVVITLLLTELQRVTAIAMSNTSGGDGDSVVLDVYSGSVRDLGGNLNLGSACLGKSIKEFPDLVPPNVVSATITNNGIEHFSYETANPTPTDLVKLNRFTIGDNGSIWTHESLLGARVTESDGYYLTIHLTENQRVRAIKMSGTPGGDGIAIVLTALKGAFVDVALNENDPVSNLRVKEINDTTRPKIMSGSINYGTGQIIQVASETLDI